MAEQSKSRESYFSNLMQLTLAGDQRAYRELLQALRVVFLVYARGFLVRMGKRDKNMAEDVVQDILVAIHEKRHTFDPTLPFLSWAFTIARYKLIDYGRKEKRRTTGLQVTELDALPAPEKSQAFDFKNELENLLGELSDSARNAINLVKIEGLTIEEAAKELAMTPSAVKVSIHRSMKTLSKIWSTKKNQGKINEEIN